MLLGCVVLTDRVGFALTSVTHQSDSPRNALRELTDLPGAAVIAAINTPEQTVISGHKAAVQLLCQKLGAKSTALRIPRAMHSPLMAPILPELGDVLASCKLSLPKVQFVSCLTGNEASQELLDVQHWLGQDQAKPVLFWRGVEKLIAMGCDAFLELGPQPVLTQMGRRINPEKLWLSSLQADEAHLVKMRCRVLAAVFVLWEPWHHSQSQPAGRQHAALRPGAGGLVLRPAPAFEACAVPAPPAAGAAEWELLYAQRRSHGS